MATQTGTSEEARIRAMIDDWSSALSAKQAKRVMAHYAEAPVLFTLAPPLVADDSDEGGLEAWFATWRGPIGNEIRDLAITVGDDVAFCHSLNRMSGTKVDGEVVELWFRQTLGLRKLGGTWKIVHEHTSVPFYMDGSLRAAVDLKP